jgi:hypothetical protein
MLNHHLQTVEADIGDLEKDPGFFFTYLLHYPTYIHNNKIFDPNPHCLWTKRSFF